MRNLCVKTFWVLILLLCVDLVAFNGTIYLLVLTKIGVPESFQMFSMGAFTVAYIAGEIYCGFAESREKKKSVVR